MNLPRLIHYSKYRVEAVKSVEQLSEDYIFPTYKPSGFWVSINDDYRGWKEWCRNSGFGLDHFEYETTVSIKDDPNLCMISSAKELNVFTREFARKETILPVKIFGKGIDWNKVAERYSGIIINPFLPECRMKKRFQWYWTWDCACGCIWDASIIEKIDCVKSEGL